MAANGKERGDLTLVDGSVDFSGGVNSIAVTTVASERHPNGLHRNQLSWLNNATVRGGGITQRMGWQMIGALPKTGADQYQGKFLYEPDFEKPYFIYVIGGRIYKVDVDDPSHGIDLTRSFATHSDSMTLPATIERAFFCQGEKYLIIQAGDNVTLPLFWDGSVLRRSIGIRTPTPASAPGQNEIPAATAMDYYMGRIWYAIGRTYMAGDIVSGPSGTAANQFRDSILSVTENPLCIGGDGFTVPTNAGNIRAIKHAANLNVQLGQGQLYIFTRKSIYSLTVPVTRTDWINANANNMPLQTVVQITNGSVNDRSVVAVNGDLFYQSLEPGIRSLAVSVRNFSEWGNTPVSINEYRIMVFNDRSLLRFGSGIEFDNRLLQTALPFQSPVGVAHQAIVPLNFDVVSNFMSRLAPVWEGMWQGMDILELGAGDFGGRQRAFATVWSALHRAIELWEITDAVRWDDQDSRVEWYIEFPAFTWGDEFMLKRLVSGELWVDKILGEVSFLMEYRPDGHVCWHPWHKWKVCTARNTCEDVHNPVCVYPRDLRESYRETMTLPKPPAQCVNAMQRPSDIGYQFQCKLTIKGWCRVRGLLLKAEELKQQLYGDMVC